MQIFPNMILNEWRCGVAKKEAQKGSFAFDCRDCKKQVTFSLFDIEVGKEKEKEKIFSCTECGKKYGFGDDTLKRQLSKFAALCRQIQASEEILGSSAVAVSVGKEEVKVPFKLLLTRLKSTLDLQVGKERFVITFRIEPTAL